MPINGGTAGFAHALSTPRLINGVAFDGTQDVTIPGGGAAWGGVTGILSDQTDLQSALDAKQPAGNYATAAQGAKADTALQQVGYAAGGSAVTQQTSKSTGVTINALCGAITMNGAALAAAAEVKFTVTNNQVAATDVPVVAIKSGGTSGSYLICVTAVAAGSFDITLSNASAGSLSQALVINFAIIKAVAA